MTRTLFALAACAAALMLAACGSSDKKKDESSTPKALAITASDGAGGKPTLTVAKEAPAGLVDVQLDNKSKQPQDATIVKLDGGHTPEDALKAVSGDMPKIPDWLHAGGGAGSTPPGQKSSTKVLLAPGNYGLLDTEGENPKQQAVAAFKVTGSGTGTLPSTAARVTVVEKGKDEFAFQPEGLKVGANEITFQNKTDELHHIVAIPFKGNATVADVKKALQTEKGPPPLDFMAGANTAVIDSKQSEVTTLDLKKPGRYAFICFLSDRKGGKPHFLDGMLQEVTVQ